MIHKFMLGRLGVALYIMRFSAPRCNVSRMILEVCQKNFQIKWSIISTK